MTEKSRIRVFSVDDHPLLSEGIATIINSEPDMFLWRRPGRGSRQ